MVGPGRRRWSTNPGGCLPPIQPNAPNEQRARGKWGGGATQHFENWGAVSVRSRGRHFLAWKTRHVNWEHRDRKGQRENGFPMAPEKSGITHGQLGVLGRLGKGARTLTGKSGEGCRVGGGRASPFPMPTASMLKVNWPRPRPRPPPRLAMVEGAWVFRDPVRKT